MMKRGNPFDTKSRDDLRAAQRAVLERIVGRWSLQVPLSRMPRPDVSNMTSAELATAEAGLRRLAAQVMSHENVTALTAELCSEFDARVMFDLFNRRIRIGHYGADPLSYTRQQILEKGNTRKRLKDDEEQWLLELILLLLYAEDVSDDGYPNPAPREESPD